MHTILVIAGGVLLGVCFGLFGHLWGEGSAGIAWSLRAFVPTWIALAAVNMWVGVARAGYSVSDEAPIFLLIAAVPVAVAIFIHVTTKP